MPDYLPVAAQEGSALRLAISGGIIDSASLTKAIHMELQMLLQKFSISVAPFSAPFQPCRFNEKFRDLFR